MLEVMRYFNVDEAGACGQSFDSGTVEHGGLHLPEASGGLTKDKHDLGHALISREAQGHGGCGQRVVLAGGEVVGQSTVVPVLFTL